MILDIITMIIIYDIMKFIINILIVRRLDVFFVLSNFLDGVGVVFAAGTIPITTMTTTMTTLEDCQDKTYNKCTNK